jgi:hypothetical protein
MNALDQKGIPMLFEEGQTHEDTDHSPPWVASLLLKEVTDEVDKEPAHSAFSEGLSLDSSLAHSVIQAHILKRRYIYLTH